MDRFENFPSRFVVPHHVDVWLPPGYADEPRRHYPVLYMHDGQNCFDAGDSSFGVAWEVQNAMEQLLAASEAQPAIITGIWNAGSRRHIEYRPARPFLVLSGDARHKVTAGLGGAPASDAYLTFITSELKPFIDSRYRTRPGRADTLIMGSSMGGLISLYALCEYPEVFGAAACLSTHWPAVEGVMLPYLREHLADPATHRLYFDSGTHTLDALYRPLQAEVDKVMHDTGYTPGVNWITREFPGACHFEADWQKRVHIPLRFLLACSDERETLPLQVAKDTPKMN